MNYLILLSEAWRIFKRSRKQIKEYSGNADQICKQIIKDCWNGKYFQVSNGHFCEFYIRDFGWCIDSLLKLGYNKEVKQTLEYVMEIYSRQGLKTTITPRGKAVDFFNYAPDSLAYLLRSLRVSKFNIDKYRFFLEKEIKKCYNLCFNENTSLVKADKYFSSMKDEAKRRSSCYDNIMLAVISKEADNLKLTNPFSKYDIKSAIKKNFWNGEYFYDDIRRNKKITGDSNIIPFWMEILLIKR